jgi:hypothetical protein
MSPLKAGSIMSSIRFCRNKLSIVRKLGQIKRHATHKKEISKIKMHYVAKLIKCENSIIIYFLKSHLTYIPVLVLFFEPLYSIDSLLCSITITFYLEWI